MHHGPQQRGAGAAAIAPAGRRTSSSWKTRMGGGRVQPARGEGHVRRRGRQRTSLSKLRFPFVELGERAERFPHRAQLALAKGRIQARHAAAADSSAASAAPAALVVIAHHREVQEDLAAVGAQLRVQPLSPTARGSSEGTADPMACSRNGDEVRPGRREGRGLPRGTSAARVPALRRSSRRTRRRCGPSPRASAKRLLYRTRPRSSPRRLE